MISRDELMVTLWRAWLRRDKNVMLFVPTEYVRSLGIGVWLRCKQTL